MVFQSGQLSLAVSRVSSCRFKCNRETQRVVLILSTTSNQMKSHNIPRFVKWWTDFFLRLRLQQTTAASCSSTGSSWARSRSRTRRVVQTWTTAPSRSPQTSRSSASAPSPHMDRLHRPMSPSQPQVQEWQTEQRFLEEERKHKAIHSVLHRQEYMLEDLVSPVFASFIPPRCGKQNKSQCFHSRLSCGDRSDPVCLICSVPSDSEKHATDKLSVDFKPIKH